MKYKGFFNIFNELSLKQIKPAYFARLESDYKNLEDSLFSTRGQYFLKKTNFFIHYMHSFASALNG